MNKKPFDQNGVPSPGSILLHIIEKDESHSVPESTFSACDSLISHTYPTKPIAIRRGHHLAFRTTSIVLVEERLAAFNIPFECNHVPGTDNKQVFFYDADGNGIEIGNFNYLQPPLVSVDASYCDEACNFTTSQIPGASIPPRGNEAPGLYDALHFKKYNSHMKVIITGGSIAGLSAALALHRIGCDVQVYERGSRLKRRGGGGIGLEEASRSALLALGVPAPTEGHSIVQEFREILEPMRYVLERDRFGKIIRKCIHEFWSAHWVGIYNSLLDALPESRVHFRSEFERFHDDGEKVSIELKSGELITGDVLVGADGSVSKVREVMRGEEEPFRDSGYFAWRGSIDLTTVRHDGAFLKRLREQYNRDIVFIEMLPHRAHTIVYYLPGGILNWILYQQKADFKDGGERYISKKDLGVSLTTDPTTDELESLMEYTKAFSHPVFHEIVSRTPAHLRFKNDILDRDPIPTYNNKSRVVLIGDAAHPCTPHWIRGSNMAIQDGYWLARCLSDVKDQNHRTHTAMSDDQLIRRWFDRFDARRVADCSNNILLARKLGKIRQGTYQIGLGECQVDPLDWMSNMDCDSYAELCGDSMTPV